MPAPWVNLNDEPFRPGNRSGFPLTVPTKPYGPQSCTVVAFSSSSSGKYKAKLDSFKTAGRKRISLDRRRLRSPVEEEVAAPSANLILIRAGFVCGIRSIV